MSIYNIKSITRKERMAVDANGKPVIQAYYEATGDSKQFGLVQPGDPDHDYTGPIPSNQTMVLAKTKGLIKPDFDSSNREDDLEMAKEFSKAKLAAYAKAEKIKKDNLARASEVRKEFFSKNN